MGTEKFSRMVPAVGHGDTIQVQSQAWGDPVTGRQRANAPGDRDGIAPAGLFSTAPYVDPADQAKVKTDKSRKNRCRAKNDTCMGFANKETGLCLGHRQKLERTGVID